MAEELAVVVCVPWGPSVVKGSVQTPCGDCGAKLAASPEALELVLVHDRVVFLCMRCALATVPDDVPRPVPGSVEKLIAKFGEGARGWVDQMLAVPLHESLTEERLRQFEDLYGGGE